MSSFLTHVAFFFSFLRASPGHHMEAESLKTSEITISTAHSPSVLWIEVRLSEPQES